MSQIQSGVEKAIERALGWSYQEQQPGGYWVAQLESSSTMEAEWILAMHFLGITDDPKTEGILKCIRSEQRPDGSWGVYYDAPGGDLNTTVECYAALRTALVSPDEPHMVAAREWILQNGGVAGTRVFTKMWLAMVGEWPWDGTPSLPPELIFFPKKFPFYLYNFSSWARATIVPLTILSSRRPVRPLPPRARMDELYPLGRDRVNTRLPKPASGGWEKFFYWADRALTAYVDFPWKPFRETAIKVCLEWIVARQEDDGCWAGIQPPWIFALLAMHTEGYPLEHPMVKAGLRAFDAPWAVETPRGTFLQACTSPVWDTLLTQLAMVDCGVDCSNLAFSRSMQWILDEQILVSGDWQHLAPPALCGGWCFEYANDQYPDIDDTAVGIMVLARIGTSFSAPARTRFALKRAVDWVTAMVCSNGGWAAFDKDNTVSLIQRIPFCDFGEAIDPPSVDVTAHVIEALGWIGRDLHDPLIAKAVDYIRKEQEPEGSWFGRWGVNHIYGTAAVLPALEKVGENMQADYVVKACQWLVAHQNGDGGWGETCASYMDDALRGRGPSTASQTAWALMGLLAQAGPEFRPSIQAGLDYLLRTQTPQGSWEEEHFTGTGFPGYGGGARVKLEGQNFNQGRELSRGFMLRYHMYRHYFPLMALGRARTFLASVGEQGR